MGVPNMRWDQLPQSDRVEDRRSEGMGRRRGGFGVPARRGGLGIGAILILGLIAWALGIDPRILIGGAEIFSGPPRQEAPRSPRDSAPGPGPTASSPESEEMRKFVGAILGSTEVQWQKLFAE